VEMPTPWFWSPSMVITRRSVPSPPARVGGHPVPEGPEVELEGVSGEALRPDLVDEEVMLVDPLGTA
jgi:hypothetical protein